MAAVPSRALAAVRRTPPALAALLVLAALLSTAWALVLPPLQGPDESAHIAAVTRLVEDGELVPDSSGLPREVLVLAEQGGLGPLVGNLAARPAWSARDADRVERALDALGDRRAEPVETPVGPPTRGVARNPPAYPLYEAVPYTAARGAGLLDRLTLMRLWNVPLLLAAVVACWLLAAEALPRRPLAPLVAGGLTALQPQLLFLSGVVNPDTALVAGFALWTWVAVRTLRRGLGRRRAVVLLALAVLVAFTHARGIVLLPCTALALALALPWSTWDGRRRLRTAVGLGAAALAGLATLAAALAGLGVSLSGTSLQSSGGFAPRELASYLWQFYLPRLPFMDPSIGGDYGVRQAFVETAWGTFASLEVQFPSWVYDVVQAALVLAVAGFLAAVARRRAGLARPAATAVLLGAVTVGVLAVLHLAAYRLLLVDRSDPVIVGRQLLVLLPVLGVIVAAAITGLGRRAAQAATALLLGGLLALDLAGLGLTVARFYA